MGERYEYVKMTEKTAYGARDRVLDDLNTITNGHADTAIKWVLEFLELEEICQEFKEKKHANNIYLGSTTVSTL